MISELSILAFTHKTTDLSDLGQLSLESAKILEVGYLLRQKFYLREFFLVNTCNRVELIYVPETFSENEISSSLDFLKRDFILLMNPLISESALQTLENTARQYKGLEAMNHLLRVSCSLDSMVVGEKEILAQIRNAYDSHKKSGFTGEILRLVMDRVVKAAKEVYTQTKISQKPISVVSIAFRKLKALKLNPTSGIILVGAGKTNTLFAKYLVKNGFKNFYVYNRTLRAAEILAATLKGKARPLIELSLHTADFDIIVVCTDSNTSLITPDIYKKLILYSKTSKAKKVLIDLSIPLNIDPMVVRDFPNYYIDLKSLQNLAAENMDERYKELAFAEKIIERNVVDFGILLKTRKVELAMKEVPFMIKEIKETAISSIFAKDIDKLDLASKETLHKVLDYMEKKYIRIPMVLAKEILINS